MNDVLSYDFTNSKAILIGSSVYADEALSDLPAVENNISELAKIILDSEIIGFHESNIHSFLNIESASKLGKEISEIINSTTDTLFFYFAGHGKVNDDGELCLTISETDVNALEFTALPFKAIKNLLAKSQAKRKILIIDSCFSGRALNFMGQNELDVFQDMDVKGTYLLTSVSKNKLAKAFDLNKEYTAFTSVLIKTLKEGIEIPRKTLLLSDIYNKIRTDSTIYNEPCNLRDQVIDNFKFAINKFSFDDFNCEDNKLISINNTVIGRIPLDILRKYEAKNKEHQQRFVLIPEGSANKIGLTNDDWVQLTFVKQNKANKELAKIFIADFEMECSVYLPLVVRNLLRIEQSDLIEKNKINKKFIIEKALLESINSLTVTPDDFISNVSATDKIPEAIAFENVLLVRSLEFELLGLEQLDKINLKVLKENKIVFEKKYHACQFADNPGRAVIGFSDKRELESIKDYIIEISK